MKKKTYAARVCIRSTLENDHKGSILILNRWLDLYDKGKKIHNTFIDATGLDVSDRDIGLTEADIVDGTQRNGSEIYLHIGFDMEMQAYTANDMLETIIDGIRKGENILEDPVLCTLEICEILKRNRFIVKKLQL